MAMLDGLKDAIRKVNDLIIDQINKDQDKGIIKLIKSKILTSLESS